MLDATLTATLQFAQVCAYLFGRVPAYKRWPVGRQSTDALLFGRSTSRLGRGEP